MPYMCMPYMCMPYMWRTADSVWCDGCDGMWWPYMSALYVQFKDLLIAKNVARECADKLWCVLVCVCVCVCVGPLVCVCVCECVVG
jgi:hypothetical protein